MFEYHAWITIQASAGDEEPEDRRTVYDRVAEEILPLQLGTGLVSLQWVNGMAQFHAAGFLNHRGGQGQEVIDIFLGIGKIAPGSYGILYVRDDEDPKGRDNEFVAFVMRRGQVAELRDQFLSPCIPMIEDED